MLACARGDKTMLALGVPRPVPLSMIQLALMRWRRGAVAFGSLFLEIDFLSRRARARIGDVC